MSEVVKKPLKITETVLRDAHQSLLATRMTMDEMRPIRYVEHPNTKSTITPFFGNQVKICEAFGFEIPDDCAPEYVVRKTNIGKRGRPRKNKLVVKEEN